MSGEVAQKVVRMEVEEVVLEDGGSLECVNRSCYLGDMLGAIGDGGEASRSRV